MSKKDEIFNNYKKSLNQKYNAVCFDIDGTLTIKDSKVIDNRAIELIANLLKRRIPIVFITGRGETGLNDLKRDIYLPLKNQYNITNSNLKKIYVLTNDGARLFYSDNCSENEFLKNDIYISTDRELNQLKDIDNKINKLMVGNNLSKFCNISYSKDLKSDIILNIRIVFNTNDINIINCVFDLINSCIRENIYENIYLTRGIFKDRSVIQIGTATKDKAIEKAEEIIGVPKNSMIRIGDCGDKYGNDYAMLNCEQGYSVDKTNNSVNSCFPIFDKAGNILTGVDATIELIKNAKILPTVCLEKSIKSDYTYKYASVEKNIVFGRNQYLFMYNSIINQKFETIDGIDGLFDNSSGSIIIPMYEWELLRNSSLKDLWTTKIDDNLAYAIRDDNNYLLRGSKTYYYLLSNRQSENEIDKTTKQNVLSWYENNLIFLKSSLDAINSPFDINNKTNKKMILGILDNCRNLLLIIINHKLVSNYFNDNVLLNLSSKDNLKFYNIYNNLLLIENLMGKLCFMLNYNIEQEILINIIKNTYNILSNELELEINTPEKEDYSKEYRTYREIDNFSENYITMNLYNEKNSQLSPIVCGLSYGGLELPIISKILNKEYINDVLLLKFNKKVSGYTNKQLYDLRKFNINNLGGIMGSENFTNSSIDLFDDNVLTGKTLQLATNSLYDCNIDVNNICIVRYPSINRINQMFMEGHGAVDYNLFFDYINGLCFKSPYSWRDDNDKDLYKDSLGVFDKNRKKIIECLLKNHDYNEISEVGEYKRRLLK